MKGLIVAFIFTLFVSNANSQNERFIEVTGNASVEVNADEVNWNVIIRKTENTFEESRIKCYEAVDNLLNILKKVRINRDQVSIPPIQQAKEYDYTSNREKVFKGFTTHLTIRFDLKDLSKYENLVEELSKSNELENISSMFGDSNYEENHKLAVRKAVNLAKEKAKYLADELNLELGKVLEIKESINNYPNPVNSSVALTGVPMDTQVVGGKITYNRNVTVKFELIDKK